MSDRKRLSTDGVPEADDQELANEEAWEQVARLKRQSLLETEALARLARTEIQADLMRSPSFGSGRNAETIETNFALRRQTTERFASQLFVTSNPHRKEDTMSKQTTEIEAATQTRAMPPVELNDDQLGAVAGGYTREEWELINKEIEKILHPK